MLIFIFLGGRLEDKRFWLVHNRWTIRNKRTEVKT